MFWIILILCVLFLFLLLGGLAGYLFACLRKKRLFDPALLPEGSPRTEYGKQCLLGGEDLRALPHEELAMTARDGKRLQADLYENGQRGRFVVLVHGYHSCPDFDFGTIAHFYLAMGYGLLLVTQRAHEDSEGILITYGAKESMDLNGWCHTLARRYPKAKILLHGISMGGATVMLASTTHLPEGVCAIIDDCGYSSAFEEITHVAKTSLHLPRFLVHVANLWSLFFTGVDLRKADITAAGANCPLPKLYIHGEQDTFVPYEMGVRNFEAAAEPKRFVSVPKAGHAMSFFVGEKQVTEEIARFAEEHLKST